MLSGATDLEKRPEPAELSEPMRWIWRGFCAALPGEGEEGVHEDAFEGRSVRVRWTRLTPATVDELLPVADRAPVAAASESEPRHEQPALELGTPPAPRALPISRLSYTGLEAYRRCGYRFYLQRTLGLAPVQSPLPPAGALGQSGMTALLRGSIVHRLIELLDFRRPLVPPDDEIASQIERHGIPALPDEVADLRAMVERLAGSRLRGRIAAARRVRTELPFAFTVVPPGAGGRSLLMNGVVDVHALEEDGTLVVDWKSDVLGDHEPEALVAESYSTQRIVYALAALRAGAERVEVAHCFLERPDEPAVAIYEAADAERLETELLELARGVVESAFTPSSEPHAAL